MPRQAALGCAAGALPAGRVSEFGFTITLTRSKSSVIYIYIYIYIYMYICVCVCIHLYISCGVEGGIFSFCTYIYSYCNVILLLLYTTRFRNNVTCNLEPWEVEERVYTINVCMAAHLELAI